MKITGGGVGGSYIQQAVRAITKSDYLAHSAPLFSRLNVLDIYQVNSFHFGKFMYKY